MIADGLCLELPVFPLMASILLTQVLAARSSQQMCWLSKVMTVSPKSSRFEKAQILPSPLLLFIIIELIIVDIIKHKFGAQALRALDRAPPLQSVAGGGLCIEQVSPAAVHTVDVGGSRKVHPSGSRHVQSRHLHPGIYLHKYKYKYANIQIENRIFTLIFTRLLGRAVYCTTCFPPDSTHFPLRLVTFWTFGN